MANLFDKEFQKKVEQENHCGEARHDSHRPAIEPRPWDDHFVSETSLWDRITRVFYGVVMIMFALAGLVIMLYWAAPGLLMSAAIVRSIVK